MLHQNFKRIHAGLQTRFCEGVFSLSAPAYAPAFASRWKELGRLRAETLTLSRLRIFTQGAHNINDTL